MKSIRSTCIRVKGKRIVNYCYLISNKKSKKSILIDPAWEIDKIEEAIKNTKTKLAAVLLTHHHGDHIDLANYFSKKYDIPTYIHEIEQEYYNFKSKNLTTFSDTELTVAGIPINAVLTPGHTKGSVCYFINNELFTGDTLFIEGCGECVSKGSSADELFDSLQALKELPDDARVFPGHRFKRTPGMSLKYVQSNNIYLQTTDKDAFARFRLRSVKETYL